MLSGILVANQLHGPGVQVLLGEANALAERGRNGLVENLQARSGAFVDLDAVEAGVLLPTAGADGPYLPRLQRVAADAVVALELRCGDELLDAVGAHDVAEMGVPKLGGTDPLLLLLDAPPDLHGDADGPFQVFVGDRDIRAWVQELDQSADRLVDRIRVPARQGAAEENAVLQLAHPALVPKLAPAFGQEIADQAEVIRDQVFVDLRHVPTRQERMDAVHEGGVVPHLRRHGTKQVPYALLVFHVDIKVADQDDAAVRADALLATAELAGLHVALHDVHAVLLVEGDA